MRFLNLCGFRLGLSELLADNVYDEAFLPFLCNSEYVGTYDFWIDSIKNVPSDDIFSKYEKISLISHRASKSRFTEPGWHDIYISLDQMCAFIDDRSRPTTQLTFSNDIGCIVRYLLGNHQGFTFHASMIDYNGQAILFSADSGVGKSTQARLWESSGKANIVNHDKPAIRLIDGRAYAFGTAWSGTDRCYVNKKLPIQAICFLRRGEQDRIERMGMHDSIHKMLEQTHAVFSERVTIDMLCDTVVDVVQHTLILDFVCTKNISAQECLEEWLCRHSGKNGAK